MDNLFFIIVGIGVIVIFAMYLSWNISKAENGTARMHEIAGLFVKVLTPLSKMNISTYPYLCSDPLIIALTINYPTAFALF